MAMAVRILGQTVRRRITSALVNPSVSFSSSSSSSLQRRLPSSLWDAFSGISVSGNEGLFVNSDGLSLLIFGRLSRATTTGGGVHIRGITTEVGTENATESSGDDPSEKTPAAATAPAVVMTPRSFQFTPVIRKMSDEIGYRVINRYTSEDFGRNKRPTAFAVVQIGSHQFKVSPNDLIYTEKLKFADINDKLMLHKVLLLGSKSQTIVGRPHVPKAAVFAVVEEHALDEKVIIFKKKRRKNYRRTTGHRQELTRLRILDIKGIEDDKKSLTSVPKESVKRAPNVEGEKSSDILVA